MPVAVIPTAKRITENRTDPKIPINRALRAYLIHPPPLDLCVEAIVATNTARYTIAMPNTTQRNTGVTVITAVI